MPMMAPTGASGGGGDESFEASASPGIQSINSTTHSVNTNIDNTSSTASTTTTSTATASSNLGSILNASDAEIQEKINAVLHDPKFPAVLLRMDQLLRGCGSKQ
ncbi:hypothetical protein BGW39_003282 [Mortierella sp. 14UC]|nr:hypothetical protein BGW39_003282 [Mortierella sp. 14UC]